MRSRRKRQVIRGLHARDCGWPRRRGFGGRVTLRPREPGQARLSRTSRCHSAYRIFRRTTPIRRRRSAAMGRISDCLFCWRATGRVGRYTGKWPANVFKKISRLRVQSSASAHLSAVQFSSVQTDEWALAIERRSWLSRHRSGMLLRSHIAEAVSRSIGLGQWILRYL